MTKRILNTTGMMAVGLLATAVHAGDLTTDNLTVYRKLRVPAAGTAAGPTSGLVFWNRYAANQTPVADDSGNGHMGTVFNAIWTAAGVQDGAYVFNGSSAYIRSIDSAYINPSAAITINAWINMATPNINAGILSKYWDGTTRDYEMHIGPSQTFAFQISIGNSHRLLDSGCVIPTGTWQMVTLWYNGSAMKAYVNGSEAASSAVSGSMNNSTEPLTIGAYTAAGGISGFFSGSIDNVRIYNRALSVEEIGTLFLADGAEYAAEVSFASGVTVRDAVLQTNAASTNVFMGRLAIGTNGMENGAKLQVHGDAKVRGTLEVTGSATGVYQTVNFAAMTNYCGTNAALFKSNGTTAMGGNIRLNGKWLSNDGGNEGVAVDNSGNVTVSGTLQVNNNLKLNNKWLSGDGGNEGVYVTAAGLVGVGTSSPGQRLSVGGGNLDMTGGAIQNVANPAADSDAANKGYVDTQVNAAINAAVETAVQAALQNVGPFGDIDMYVYP